ncbi:FtsX-like permease family protein [Clostridium sp. LY3-2]|uniref:FtsX-like permease family protein n=1 Tax=Clostridium sp. LY3-2 TaxID=2942482 RepID=UPI0021521448|nr:FtsX-like permease family protein [Clostridium sp. LY3-2]MCR6514461.1 FtsX-like permease family protein [Clostridium sp. LY3-2]
MNSSLYPKLALTNIKKNSRLYIPYILTCIVTIAMFYVIFELANNPGMKKLPGATGIISLMSFGVVIIGILSAVFIFYANSFLIKQRKKEFGLFNILGMEKRHIARIVFFENLYVSLGSLVTGILLGLLLNKLMFLLLLKLLKFEVQMGFEFSRIALIGTVILFTIVFTLVLTTTIIQIYRSKPIELIKGKSVGEREPKNKWIITIIGLISLSIGYYISVTTTNKLAVVNLFFVAVLFVCIGVYCLFTSGSITLLKILRKNKNYYYKTNHFISVSTMMYRMKQSAFGLANICILSTSVLVVVSSTVALYVGSEDIIKSRYPKEITITLNKASDKAIEDVNKTVDKILEENKVSAVDLASYKMKTGILSKEGDKFIVNDGVTFIANGDVSTVIPITLEDYNKVMKENKTLKDNEVLMYSNREKYNKDSFSIDGKTFNIKEKLKECVPNGMNTASIFNTDYIVVKDDNTFKELLKNSNEEYYYGFDLSNKDLNGKVYDEINKELKGVQDKYKIKTELADRERADFYSIFGGLFFLGIFLGTLFIMATILIMYYKQLSEGYDDKERYNIMQKVGLSKREIKSTINSQVLTVFFMPLAFAIVNIAFAFPSITRLLEALNFTNAKLYAAYTGVTCLVFALCYGAVYLVTAKIYYKIVE